MPPDPGHLETSTHIPSPAEGSQPEPLKYPQRGVLRSLGLGLITGAADDDPSAIGTYASAGAKFGFPFLWIAPLMFPMMVTVVYLSSKLGQVAGKGLFAVIRDRYPRWVLWSTLTGVLIGNTFEAGADLGGMAAALKLLVPVRIGWIVFSVALAILALQIWGSYRLIRNAFRWLSLALLAYIAAAIQAKPQLLPLLKGTLIPQIQWNRDFLAMLVATMGASLSAYLYTWQSNVEVEEKVSKGRTQLADRRGASRAEVDESRRDVMSGMFFADIILYAITLSTAATLFKAGHHDINTAAQAAQALQPIAGKAAGLLFAVGVVAVGFLAIPVMTTGAAYDLCQTLGWKHGLYTKPSEAKKFYVAIVAFTAVTVGMNFAGMNPMKALVWAGIVQGLSTPVLMLLIMLMTNQKSIIGARANTWVANAFGWVTTAAIFAASIALIVTWIE